VFIPCYIDDFYPDVAMATLDILEANGVSVDYPFSQNCCGQLLSITVPSMRRKTWPQNILYETFPESAEHTPHTTILSPLRVASIRHGKIPLQRNLIGWHHVWDSKSKIVLSFVQFLYDVVGLDHRFTSIPQSHNSRHSSKGFHQPASSIPH